MRRVPRAAPPEGRSAARAPARGLLGAARATRKINSTTDPLHYHVRAPAIIFIVFPITFYSPIHTYTYIYIQTFIIEIWRYVHIYSYFSKRNLFHSIEIHSQITRRKNIYSRKALKTHFVVFGRRGQKRARFQVKSVSLIHVTKTLGIFTLALERHVPKKKFCRGALSLARRIFQIRISCFPIANATHLHKN